MRLKNLEKTSFSWVYSLRTMSADTIKKAGISPYGETRHFLKKIVILAKNTYTKKYSTFILEKAKTVPSLDIFGKYFINSFT
jgi:hypothetical protein